MTTTTDTTRFELLHALAVKGLASDEVLAAMTGMDADALRAEVLAAVDDGLVIRREGRISGTMITPAGRARLAELLELLPLSDAALAAANTCYDDFLPLNGEFKRVCAAWQMRDETTPNDHTDADYDDGVIGQLDAVESRIDDILADVESSIPRLGRYRGRLVAAQDKVHAGDKAAFARPMYDSYHDIWMELHQDLLLTTGHERGAADEG